MEKDINKLNDAIFTQTAFYKPKYDQYGFTPKALGHDKGKQDIRFDILTSQYECTDKSILDIGCGFGDLNQTLKKFGTYSYHGIDIMEDFIAEARKHYSGKNITFEQISFLDESFQKRYDYAVLSGSLNIKMEGVDQYKYAELFMKKAYDLTKDGFAFDFLSSRVDYTLDHAFHYDPAMILNMAYSFSRNVALRNDYMPFEFTVFVFKDDSFAKEDTLFSRFKKIFNDKNK